MTEHTTEELWQQLLLNLEKSPRDIPTRPITRKKPIWFYAESDGRSIFVSPSKTQQPSTGIQPHSKLDLTGFTKIYPIHVRRENGESVSQEAKAVTHYQVYWYGLIHACLPLT